MNTFLGCICSHLQVVSRAYLSEYRTGVLELDSKLSWGVLVFEEAAGGDDSEANHHV